MRRRFCFERQADVVATEGRASMNGKGYSIVFSSRTGNTTELAEAVRGALPEEACEHFGSVDGDGNCDDGCGCAGDGDRNGSSFGSSTGAIPASETLFVGFWTNQGVADQAAQKLLKQLRGRKIFLFGTAGFGGSEAYFQAILDKTKAFIDDSNTVIGTFMCQGKMPQSVRERYVKMKEQPNHMPNLDAMIENFDKALSHPDADDLEKLANLARETVGQ